MSGHEILEHTADVGVRAWGASLEEAFEQAGWGLVDVLGARAGPLPSGREHEMAIAGGDEGALLVDFLNELLWLHETEEAVFAGIRVHEASEEGLRATVALEPLRGEVEGVGVKAATYHQLQVARSDGHVEVRVYLDV